MLSYEALEVGEQGALLQRELLRLGVAVTGVTEEVKVGASVGCRRNWELSLGEGAEQSNPSFSHLLPHFPPQQPGTGHHWD